MITRTAGWVLSRDLDLNFKASCRLCPEKTRRYHRGSREDCEEWRILHFMAQHQGIWLTRDVKADGRIYFNQCVEAKVPPRRAKQVVA